MAYLWKWASFIIFVPSLVLAQSASSTTAQQNGSEPASPTSGASTGGAAPMPEPTVADSKTLEIVARQSAKYPLAARRDGIQGEVMVEVLVSETGDVEKTEVLSGDPILADAAVQAAKMFKFKPFFRNGKPVKVWTKMPFDFQSGALMTDASGAKANSAPSSGMAGDSSQRVFLSEKLIAGSIIHKVRPIYPELAKARRVEGSVTLEAVIGKDGRIKDIKPISGPKLLIPAAVEAVQQWIYKPYTLGGQPVEVDTRINVNFTLSGVQFSR